MPFNPNTGNYDPPAKKWFVIGGCAALVFLIALIGGCSYATSYDAPRKGYSAICQTGGPIEGDSGTCGFMPSGSGKSMIGYKNTLVEFPANNRFWRAASDKDGQGTARGADIQSVEFPASNGGIVSADYVMRFKLKQDEKSMVAFYKTQATRSYGGPLAADDPDKWFLSWEASQLSPIIEKALREEGSVHSCAEMNPSCDLTKLNADLEKLAADNVPDTAVQKEQADKGRQANQTLSDVAQKVEDRIAGPDGEFAKAFEGEFLADIDFQLVKINPPSTLVDEINGANAALAGLVKKKAEARTKVADAKGTADARREEAGGKRALAEAYTKNGALAQIEAYKALCGETGCQNLQVLGGGSNLLTQLGSPK